ncbi:MAG TPA: hypothetical protein VD866_15635 [Urbifossiella sp.]|nr:hypothetical protein [Urbifossiella sp.]
MTRRFAVVHEAEADFQTATDLADRVLVEAFASWLDDESVVYPREWLSQEPGGRRLTWKAMRRLAEAAGIEAEGFFDGRPGLADARAARRAILYLRAAFPELDGIVLIRDQDDQPERRAGLQQARTEHHSPVVIVGLAVVEREAWVISGFEPRDDEETTRLSTERQALGFNPCERSHDLTACKDDTAKRNPKRVLCALTQDDRDREAYCWQVTPLSTLKQRGGENGLAAYLAEVRQHLAPLIGS